MVIPKFLNLAFSKPGTTPLRALRANMAWESDNINVYSWLVSSVTCLRPSISALVRSLTSVQSTYYLSKLCYNMSVSFCCLTSMTWARLRLVASPALVRADHEPPMLCVSSVGIQPAWYWGWRDVFHYALWSNCSEGYKK